LCRLASSAKVVRRRVQPTKRVGIMPIPDSTQLDELRRLGDPLIDPLVAEFFGNDRAAEGKLIGQLFSDPKLPDHPFVKKYLAALPPVTFEDPARIERGQAVFALFGPEVLLSLGSCALPLAYAAGKGVQVVYRARKLKEDPIRRLCDTAQMVINVMEPGELAEGGIGWVSARKTRLIHALIRHHISADPDPKHPWPAELGVPINQEDLTGTLLTFSIAVVQCLRKIGAKLSEEQANDYVYAWMEIAKLLGLDRATLPRNEGEGMELALRIGERQIEGTKEGKELNDQLLKAVGSVFFAEGYAANLSRFLLEGSAFGKDVATKLEIPSPPISRFLVNARALHKRLMLQVMDWVPGAKQRRSVVAVRFVQQMLKWRRGGDGHVPFAIPERLRIEWKL